MSPIASISFCKGISVVTNSSPVISVINNFNYFFCTTAKLRVEQEKNGRWRLRQNFGALKISVFDVYNKRLQVVC